MKKSFLFIAACITLLSISCQTSTKSTNETNFSLDSTAILDTNHTSQNSLDWAGTYQDTIPCADCPGILTTVKLFDNGTFSYQADYLERKTVVQDTGVFMWHNNGSVIHLKGKETDVKYKVGENILLQADSAGHIITTDMADLFHLPKIL